MKYNSFGNIYEDLLIGEYRYIEDGVVKVNTLDLMTNPPSEFYEHNIIGNIILASDNYPLCADCLFEKRVSLTFFDPNRSSDNGLWGKLLLRRVDEGDVQKIKATLSITGHVISVDGVPPEYSTFTVPAGNYILTKE